MGIGIEAANNIAVVAALVGILSLVIAISGMLDHPQMKNDLEYITKVTEDIRKLFESHISTEKHPNEILPLLIDSTNQKFSIQKAYAQGISNEPRGKDIPLLLQVAIISISISIAAGTYWFVKRKQELEKPLHIKKHVVSIQLDHMIKRLLRIQDHYLEKDVEKRVENNFKLDSGKKHAFVTELDEVYEKLEILFISNHELFFNSIIDDFNSFRDLFDEFNSQNELKINETRNAVKLIHHLRDIITEMKKLDN